MSQILLKSEKCVNEDDFNSKYFKLFFAFSKKIYLENIDKKI